LKKVLTCFLNRLIIKQTFRKEVMDMAGQKSVSPAVTVIVIIIVLAIIFAVYWWTSHKPAATPTGPMMPKGMPGGANMPGGMKGMPGGMNMPGGAKGMPGGMMKGPMGPQAPTPPAGQ
jgi:hypothetical protein